MSFVLIPAGWDYAVRAPAKVYPSDDAVVVAESADGDRIVVMSATRAVALAGPAAKDASRQIVEARIGRLLPEAGAAEGWEWSGTERMVAPLRAPEDPDLVPRSQDWIGYVGTHAVRVDVAGDVARCAVALSDAGAARRTPTDSAHRLLAALCMAGRLLPGCAAMSERLLAGQAPTLATGGRLGSHGRQNRLLDDPGQWLVWNRVAAGRPTHVIQAHHRLLASHVSGNPPAAAPGVSVRWLLDLLPVLDAVVGAHGVEGEGSRVMTLADGRWSALDGTTVEQTETGWRVVVDDPSRWPETVDALVLGDPGAPIALHCSPPTATRDAIEQLATATAVAPPSLRVALPELDGGRWLGVFAARAATRQRAVEWLGERAPVQDIAAVDNVVDIALRLRVSPMTVLTPAMRLSLDRVGAADLEERRFGSQVLANLVMGHALNNRGDPEQPGAFADALTTLLASYGSTQLEYRGWAISRVLTAVGEFVLGRSTPQARVLPDTVPRAPRWRKLEPWAPWLWYYVPRRAWPEAGVPVSPEEFVDILALVRPLQVPQAPGSAQEQERLVPALKMAELAELFRLPDDATTEPAALAQLAHALEWLFIDPASAAGRVQGVRLPPSLRAAVDSRLEAYGGAATRPEDLLVVRADRDGRPRAAIANLSRERWLGLRLGGDPLRLPPLALDEHGAYDYAAAPVEIAESDVIEIAGTTVPLHAERPEMSALATLTLPQVPRELFRGRDEQLARLLALLGSRGPRPGALIFGPRRAGKSTLANRVGEDELSRARLWLDMSNTPTRVSEYGEWSSAICRSLERKARLMLGLTFEDGLGTDLVGALELLDEALEGSKPVVVVLDELDVLLLPEQGGDGRRTAGRLGNLALNNLLLVGTVQRFHRSVQEFKSWESVECPADLSWRHGVTYFYPHLADLETPGPRVEFPSRAVAGPRVFADEIAPAIGLRPYFWAQLRSRMEAAVRSSGGETRFLASDEVRKHLDSLLYEDPHLSAVLDPGLDLTPDERRRKDLFGDDERQVLRLLAADNSSAPSVALDDAVAVGGESAVQELLDRAYVTWNASGTRLTAAVPIYQRYLRLRRRDLDLMLGPRQPASGEPAAVTAATDVVPDEEEVRAFAMWTLEENGGSMPGTSLGTALRKRFPELGTTRWAGFGTLRGYIGHVLAATGVTVRNVSTAAGGTNILVVARGTQPEEASVSLVAGSWAEKAAQRLTELVRDAPGPLRIRDVDAALRGEGLVPPRTRPGRNLTAQLVTHAPSLAFGLGFVWDPLRHDTPTDIDSDAGDD